MWIFIRFTITVLWCVFDYLGVFKILLVCFLNVQYV